MCTAFQDQGKALGGAPRGTSAAFGRSTVERHRELTRSLWPLPFRLVGERVFRRIGGARGAVRGVGEKNGCALTRNCQSEFLQTVLQNGVLEEKDDRPRTSTVLWRPQNRIRSNVDAFCTGSVHVKVLLKNNRVYWRSRSMECRILDYSRGTSAWYRWRRVFGPIEMEERVGQRGGGTREWAAVSL